MDITQSVNPHPPLKPRRVAPACSSKPEGAWQEEESLEVYKRKTTHKPPSDDSREIIRVIKRHPRTGEEIYETVPPRRDSPREIILLEPVQFRGHSPDTAYDDYALYRMEEYVDASSDICSKEKDAAYYIAEKPTKDICSTEEEPVYYTVEKATKQEKRTEEQDVIVEDHLSPAKEIETTTFTRQRHFEEQSDISDRLSTKSHPIGTPTPFEVCSYRPQLPTVADTISEEVEIERTSDLERADRAYYQSEKDEKTQTPLLDRTIYYEREVLGRPPEVSRAPTRQTYFVDEDIVDTNRKVDSVLQDRETKGSSHLSIPDVVEKRREERSSVEEFRRIQKERSEVIESPRATSERRERTYRHESPVRICRDSDYTRELPVRTRRDSDYLMDYEKYERATYAPPSRSVSVTRSSRTASNHTPYCQHRKISREYEESLRQERKTIRDVPIRREFRHPPSHHETLHLRQVAEQKRRPYNGKSSCYGRPLAHPIHEVITTEKFERVERIRRRVPGTLV